MDFSLFKNLDKAFDKAFDTAIESIEKTVTDKVGQAALSVVEEFPNRHVPDTRVLVSSTAAGRVKLAANAWQEFDLEGHKPQWEALCKHVNDLRQKDAAAVEASSWAKRAAEAEDQLLLLLTALLQCPDPADMVANTAAWSAKAIEAEERCRQLQQEADASRADAQEVAQLVDKHRQLEAAHTQLQETLRQREAQLAELQPLAATAAAAATAQQEQAAEVARLQAVLRTLRQEHELAQSALFEATAAREAEAGARASELDAANEELERTQLRLQELEMERDAMAAQLREGGAKPVAGGPAADSFWEAAVQSREQQLAALRRDLQAAQAAAQDAATSHAAELAVLQDRLAVAEARAERMHQELATRPHQQQLQELQQRVSGLSALLDTQLEAEGWAPDAVAAAQEGVGSPQAVDALLQERNRKLAAELASVRNHAAVQVQNLAAAEQQLEELRAALEQRNQLLVRLEEDLLASSARRHTDSVLAPSPSSEVVVTVSQEGELVAPPTSQALLDIVAGQRDRFRGRCTQLEEDKGKLQASLSAAQKRVDELSRDNVALVGKIRYLEEFSQKAAAGAGRSTVVRVDADGTADTPQDEDRQANRYRCGPLALDLGPAGPQLSGAVTTSGAAGARSRARGARQRGLACFPLDEPADEEGGAEGRYARDYEARLNPFAAFQQRESEQRIKNLNMHDRALLSGGRLLLGSSAARLFLAAYALLLHLFILLLIYYSARPVLAAASCPQLPAAAAAATADPAAAAVLL